MPPISNEAIDQLLADLVQKSAAGPVSVGHAMLELFLARFQRLEAEVGDALASAQAWQEKYDALLAQAKDAREA